MSNVLFLIFGSCGDVISEGEGTTVNGDLLCQGCYDDYYRRCENSDRIIHDNDVNWPATAAMMILIRQLTVLPQ